MTNKTKKKALVSSIIALLGCFLMLLGTTFAWFTDSHASGINTIVAGNLDVELYHADKAASADAEVESDTKLFDDVTLWEPGAVVWEKLIVKNAGSLALKYKLNFNVSDVSTTAGGKSLRDVLKVAVMDVQPTRNNVASATSQSLETFSLVTDKALTSGNSDVFYVAIYWEPSANDNDYNIAGGELKANIGISLVATQCTVESDGFDDQYDANASYIDVPTFPTAMVSELPEYVDTVIDWRETTIENQQLEAVYVFEAPHDLDTIGDCEYKDWVCDFYVSVDRDVPANSIFLGGYYELYGGWLGFDNGDLEVSANEEIALMSSMLGGDLTYELVAGYISPFYCGVAHVGDALDGATFTVKLCLTNPETGIRVTVNTVNYTFD